MPNIILDILSGAVLFFTVLGVSVTVYFGVKKIRKTIKERNEKRNKGEDGGDLELSGEDRPDPPVFNKSAAEETGEDDDGEETEKIDCDADSVGYVDEHIEDYVRLLRDCLSDSVTQADNESRLRQYSWMQKAAFFIIAVGSGVSSRIFAFLREDEIDAIVFEVSRVESVFYGQKVQILQEFERLAKSYQLISAGGVGYARELLEKTFGAKTAVETLNRLNSSLQVKPFDFIRRANPSHLLNFIRQEHPQVIALVLSYLEPNKASAILENLPHETRGDVARRVAGMGSVSPEIVRCIERVIEKKLSSLSSENYIVLGGVEAVVEILNLTNRATEKQIIEELEDTDPELAEAVKQRMFIFEDVIMLDDRAIQKVMREVDSQELAKSLKSVDSEVQEKFFRNMSRRAASMLKEDMEYMGPVRLKDVEEAQLKIVSIIRYLEECGEIVVARAGEDELVV